MNKALIGLLAAALGFGALAQAAVDQLSVFESGTHCVGYRVKKRLFFVASVQVVGKSCEPAVQVIPEIGDRYKIEIAVNVRTLKSGEEKRDQDVAELLKADEQPEIYFVSEGLTAEEWQTRVKTGRFKLKGELKVANQRHALEAQVVIFKGVQGLEADGVIETSFQNLDLRPPKLGAGIIASVRDAIELDFHFISKKVLGADSILKSE